MPKLWSVCDAQDHLQLTDTSIELPIFEYPLSSYVWNTFPGAVHVVDGTVISGIHDMAQHSMLFLVQATAAGQAIGKLARR